MLAAPLLTGKTLKTQPNTFPALIESEACQTAPPVAYESFILAPVTVIVPDDFTSVAAVPAVLALSIMRL